MLIPNLENAALMIPLRKKILINYLQFENHDEFITFAVFHTIKYRQQYPLFSRKLLINSNKFLCRICIMIYPIESLFLLSTLTYQNLSISILEISFCSIQQSRNGKRSFLLLFGGLTWKSCKNLLNTKIRRKFLCCFLFLLQSLLMIRHDASHSTYVEWK